MVNFTMLTYNRSRLTRQSLESLSESRGFNLTIVDDVSTDPAMDLSKWTEWCEDTHIVYNQVSDGNGMARNQVIGEAEATWGREEWLYLSDNDCFFLQPDWLQILCSCLEAVEHSGFKAIGAYNHPFHRPIGVYEGAAGFKVKEVYALATQSMLMRWETFDEFGPFCRTPVGKVCQSEDADFCNRIRAAGFRVGVVTPPLLVNTGITNSCGEKIPGWAEVLAERVPGVYVE